MKQALLWGRRIARKNFDAMNHFWFYVIVTGWALIALATFIPASVWFEVRSVKVVGIDEEGCPVLQVDRSIYRQATGDWYVDLNKSIGKGKGFAQFLHGQGSANYTPADALPDPLTLDWWMGLHPDIACNLPPGVYKLDHIWLFKPSWQAVRKQVTIQSEPFTIPKK